jgi:hypothetical protein
LSFPLPAGLDPTWEETFEFTVGDEATTKCFVKFMMGAEGEEKQIGDECEWQLFVRIYGLGISIAQVLVWQWSCSEEQSCHSQQLHLVRCLVRCSPYGARTAAAEATKAAHWLAPRCNIPGSALLCAVLTEEVPAAIMSQILEMCSI